MSEIAVRRVVTNGIEITVAVAGRGDPVLLLHGFPHTWRLWQEVMPRLARTHRVIAPDLRGLGSTERPSDGYDAGTLATDAECLLDALGEPAASVVGIDAGTPPAFLLAMRRPERVRRLVLLESLLGRLPGAEDFLRGGPPWWFGFHAVPGLAETVLIGHEAEYVDWFLDAGTHGRGVPPEIRDRFVEAYRGHDALRAAFSHYRAMPESARQIDEAVASGKLTVPAMAIGAHPVGNALERQLRPVAEDLVAHLVADCGHLVPLDRPEVLGPLLEDFLAERQESGPLV